ncbi:MAG: hypothetical protein J6K42_01720 [Clostridia bacterium]|nr:hypothetical protein [Clostridia bacterium]
MEFLNDSELLNRIEKYIKNNQLDYAILIDGQWGSGKSYFMNKRVIPKINEFNEKTPIYVSLNGVVDKKEIAEKIYLKIFEDSLSDNKVMQIVKKGGKLFLITAKIASSIVEKELNCSLPSVTKENVTNILETISNIDKYVFIFDDLERCAIKPSIVLGYINEFIEHKKCKCIIITNQEEINNTKLFDNTELKYLIASNLKITINEKEDNSDEKIGVEKLKQRANYIFNSSNEYNQIKEKLIGETYYYKANLDEVIVCISKNMKYKEDVKNLLIEKKTAIKNKLEYYNHYNIRTLKSAVYHYDEIKNNIENFDYDKEDNYYKLALNYLFDQVLEEEILYKKGLKNKKGIADKFSDFEFDNLNEILFHSVKNFISSGVLDVSLLKEEFTKYCEVLKADCRDPKDPIKKLSLARVMEDKEVIKLIEDLKQRLKKLQYPFELYPSIVASMIIIKSMGFDQSDFDDIVNIMKKNIQESKYQSEFLDFGVGLDKQNQKDEYYKIMNEMNDIAKKNKCNIDLNNYIISEKNWSNQLYNYCKDNQFDIWKYGKFLSCMNIDNLVEVISNSDSADIFEFGRILNIIYRLDKIGKFDINDIHCIRDLKSKIDGLDVSRFDKVKTFNINGLKESLNNISMSLNDDKEM